MIQINSPILNKILSFILLTYSLSTQLKPAELFFVLLLPIFNILISIIIFLARILIQVQLSQIPLPPHILLVQYLTLSLLYIFFLVLVLSIVQILVMFLYESVQFWLFTDGLVVGMCGWDVEQGVVYGFVGGSCGVE